MKGNWLFSFSDRFSKEEAQGETKTHCLKITPKCLTSINNDLKSFLDIFQYCAEQYSLASSTPTVPHL